MPQPKTRCWSVPTSPRSPGKLVGVLQLLQRFEGHLWNKETQRKYGELLPNYDYEGEAYREPDFHARDRVNRAPKTFGLARIDAPEPLYVTRAGMELLNGEHIEDLWLRQLLKWQYPSPAHDDRDYVDFFRVKPFLEILRLVRDCEGLMKEELAIFGVYLIDYRQYETVRQELLGYRQTLDALA